MDYRRYGIYDLPEQKWLSESGTSWLGWDAVTGQHVHQTDLTGIDVVTDTPRKYGFHATLKPPFRLAEGCDIESLSRSLSTFASITKPVMCDGLQLSVIGKFLALTPTGNTRSIDELAMLCVTSMDPYRASLNESELARRRSTGLSDRQEALLEQWGYPYVAEEFNFHITLTGSLDALELQKWRTAAENHFKFSSPYRINSVALAGEREDGYFELIERYALTG